jgi:hypothetical protein
MPKNKGSFTSQRNELSMGKKKKMSQLWVEMGISSKKYIKYQKKNVGIWTTWLLLIFFFFFFFFLQLLEKAPQ